MTVTTTTGAGLLGPEDLRPLLFVPFEVNSLAVDVATVEYTPSHRFRIPKVTADPSAEWVAEGEEITPTTPTLAEVVVTPSKVAGLTVASRELVRDSANGQGAEQIGYGLARDIARKVDQAFFGNLAAPAPKGLGSLTGVVAVAQAATISTTDAFTEGVYKAAEKDATLTHWILNPADAQALAQAKEGTTSARGLLQPDPTQAGRRTIEGLPILTSKHVAPRTIWGIDKTQCLIVIREDATVEADSSAFFTSDRVAVKATMRVGLGFTNPAGVVKITRAAS